MLHELIKIWFGWVEHWGYTGVFILMAMESSIIPVPSEIVMPPAAFWAAQGKMDFTGVVLAGTFGSYVGSAISYWVAQWVGTPILNRYGKYLLLPPEKLALAEAWVKRFGMTGIFLARLLPVVRHLISIPAGILRMPYWKFSAVTILGAGLWCWVLAWFGREVIGSNPELIQSPEAMVAVMKAKLFWFVGGIVLLAVLYGFVAWFKTKSTSLFLALLACSSFFSGCAHFPPPLDKPAPSVILISIDGLHPTHYRHTLKETPNLQKLAALGVSADAVLPVYPSNTFPNHASLATGVPPALHGVVSNRVFDLQAGPTINWYFDSRIFQTPALWDVASGLGLKTAILGWPVSLNAQAAWLVPEVFSPYGIDHQKNWQRTVEETNPALLRELTAHSQIKNITSNIEYDQWMTDSAILVLKKYRPNLTLLHYRAYDGEAHASGKASPESMQALQAIDSMIGQILQTIDLTKTTLLVTGDHGFADVHSEFELNTLFAKKGWIQLKNKKPFSWSVIAHSGGNQAAIYVKDKRLEPEVLALLKSKGRFKMFDQTQLKKMGALPDAYCAVEAEAGYGFGQKYDGPWIHKLNKTIGEHGAHAERPEMWTGFIAAGAQVPARLRLRRISVLDIAPTVSQLLGAAMPSAKSPALKLTP